VIVNVPEAEAVVGRFRAVLDPSAALGVPAHVTVLFPFVPPASIDRDIITALSDVVSSFGSFDVIFRRVSWFSDTVAWLAPEPADPFLKLIELVWKRFPDYPPYGGIYEDVIPHLTIGEGAPLNDMRLAAEAIAPNLPISQRVDRLTLIQGSSRPGSWHTVTELPLE
jgi:2'-5' RNA ligase